MTTEPTTSPSTSETESNKAPTAPVVQSEPPRTPEPIVPPIAPEPAPVVQSEPPRTPEVEVVPEPVVTKPPTSDPAPKNQEDSETSKTISDQKKEIEALQAVVKQQLLKGVPASLVPVLDKMPVAQINTYLASPEYKQLQDTLSQATTGKEGTQKEASPEVVEKVSNSTSPTTPPKPKTWSDVDKAALGNALMGNLS